jgi:adenine-specific DNA-methyltransferase
MAQTPIDSIKHKDKRANIPTEELRDFVADDERTPETILYPRDPSLDPQLVWKGKDEQDIQPLEVQSVPIYIQEKIYPQTIIEEVRAQAKKDKKEYQLSLFDDFNGIEFEYLIDFYRHEQNWTNRMILGDSLLVMTSLAEKEGLKGQVQMIYIDPPYGIKFGSNWQVSTRKRDVKDTNVEDITRQPEQIKAFRDTWELGIHSYLTYLRDRLVVARELLTESGSIFVQIGDENVHLVRCLMDEVFGVGNFCGQLTYKVTSGTQRKIGPRRISDFILWYVKDIEQGKFRRLYLAKTLGEDSTFTSVQLKDGTRRSMTKAEQENPSLLPFDSMPFRTLPLHSQGAGDNQEREFQGRKWAIPSTRHWRYSQNGFARLVTSGRIQAGKSVLEAVYYFDDFQVSEITTTWNDTAPETDKNYVVQTSILPIQRCLLMTTDPGDLVLDPTCGSGTTAYVAEQWGCRWITIDTSRVALAIARTRLMAAKYPYYLLADSLDGIQKETEITGQIPPTPLPKTDNDIKKGFVYKRVPHITLRDIANNPEIDTIHAKWQEKLEPIRAQLNQLLHQEWEEWEIPREAEKTWSKDVQQLHQEWWRLRQERQKEIDDSITRNSDQELLYDQPYEDNKMIRVTGPFTIESLSPHRVLSTDAERPTSETEVQKQATVGQFETMIIENLRKAGVQNTVKNERLKFDRLETYAGTYLHAEGEYSENGTNKRAAICIGPEHGTVGPELIKDAAKEAVQGIGFDLLIVCGFAFDPHVSEEITRYGRLTVLPARMNPDLAMGDELLKKTGAGNLFMVFGEPDIDVNKQPDGNLVVELKGVDVYDPTTGQIRSSSTDDIACWFIDTDYNEESFFVRHAYFCGADQPYERLQRALRAEIDETAWSALYSTESYSFSPPSTGKIAVKVINHYGDEVLKVYKVVSTVTKFFKQI